MQDLADLIPVCAARGFVQPSGRQLSSFANFLNSLLPLSASAFQERFFEVMGSQPVEIKEALEVRIAHVIILISESKLSYSLFHQWYN